MVCAGDGDRGPDRANRQLGPARCGGAGRTARELHLDLRLRGGRVSEHPPPDQRGRGSDLFASRSTSASPTSPAIPASCRTAGSPWPGSIGSAHARIRARSAASIDAPFEPASEVVLFEASPGRRRRRRARPPAMRSSRWARGRTDWRIAEALPDGDIGVVHYAPGPAGGIDVRWVRLAIDGERGPRRWTPRQTACQRHPGRDGDVRGRAAADVRARLLRVRRPRRATFRGNLAAWGRWWLLPRMLIDVVAGLARDDRPRPADRLADHGRADGLAAAGPPRRGAGYRPCGGGGRARS